MADSNDFKELIKASAEFGMRNKGGGVFGNAITFLFVKLIGKNGTYVALGALIFSSIVLLTNQSIKRLIPMKKSLWQNFWKRNNLSMTFTYKPTRNCYDI